MEQGCWPRTGRHSSKQYQDRRRRISQKQTTFESDQRVFCKRPISRMLNKHPDAISAKLKEAKQDHPKAASDYIMLKSPVRPNRSVFEPNTIL